MLTPSHDGHNDRDRDSLQIPDVDSIAMAKGLKQLTFRNRKGDPRTLLRPSCEATSESYDRPIPK